MASSWSACSTVERRLRAGDDGIYRSLLARIQAHPERSLARRLSLSPAEKALVARTRNLGSGA